MGSNRGINPESPCAICRSYGHFTHNHPDGYVNPIYDLLAPPLVDTDHDACGCEKCHPEIHSTPVWGNSSGL